MNPDENNSSQNQPKKVKKNLFSLKNLTIFLALLIIIVFASSSIYLFSLVQKKDQELRDSQTVSSRSSSTRSSSGLINNLSQSSSSTSSQSSSSLQSSSKNNEELLFYTNQFLPSLKLAYHKSWKMESTTSPSIYKDLLERKVTLTKNGTTLVFSTRPMVATGCAGDYEVVSKTKLNSGLFKITAKNNSGQNIVNFNKNETFSCTLDNTLTSTIDAGGIKEYKETFKEDAKVRFLYSFRPANSQDEFLETNPLINEITDMISKSTF
jgi:cytoskeletal protein RodZ